MLLSWAIKTGLAYTFLASFICLLAAAELAFPREKPMAVSERLRVVSFSAIYLPIAIAMAMLISQTLYSFGARPLIQVSAWWGAALALLLTDFLYYWYHRAQHSVPLLWRYHAVHHSIEKMGAGTGFHHLLEVPGKALFVSIPLAFVISRSDGPLLAFLFSIHGYYIHSTTRLNFGPVAWVIADNRTHRIHHSVDPNHLNRNFGALTMLWDRLFGTAYWPAAEWPDIGLSDRREPRSVREYVALSRIDPDGASPAVAASAAREPDGVNVR